MQITRSGTQPSAKGPADWFTGSVRHGTSPMTAMTHIAIAEMLDGNAVEWMEKVSDEQYGG
jgi:hypothetical protein